MAEQRQREGAAPEPNLFPQCGFRARRWQRFERDLSAWMASPEGGFAVWRAARAVADGPAAGDSVTR